MSERHELYCPLHGRRIGNAVANVLWTGVVKRLPDEFDGLEYHPCEACRQAKRPQWHRYEIIPPNPIVEIHVPVITSDEAA